MFNIILIVNAETHFYYNFSSDNFFIIPSLTMFLFVSILDINYYGSEVFSITRLLAILLQIEF